MAFKCNHGNDHFHVCPELVLLEIVDENNRQVPVGGKGRVLITPFFNSAQPLIRYEQGDIVVRGAGCPGGLTLPVIKEISGRKDAIFKFPDRDVAIVGLDVVEIRKLLQADAFQFAQVGVISNLGFPAKQLFVLHPTFVKSFSLRLQNYNSLFR